MSVLAAAREGDLDGVKAAVQNGADIEERGGSWGGTALHYACSYGHTLVAEYLIERGAEVNGRDEIDNLPIHEACLRGHLDTVKLLINKGSDFTSTNNYGSTPLYFASYNGNALVAEYLIERGAEVSCRDKNGNLPIHSVCRLGHLDIVKLLINKGSDFTSTSNYDRTPLHVASHNGHTLVAKYLIERGAEVNCRDKNGSLPIHSACWSGHLDTVKLLINKGSDFTSTNNCGSTPLHLASRYGYTGVTDYLTQHGAGERPMDTNIPETLETDEKLQVTNAVVSETLKHGKKKNNRVSLLFIGQDGVGKTSLKKSLLGEESNEKEPSTVGIEFDVVEVNDNDKSKPWKRSADDQFIASQNYAYGVLGREIAKKIAESKEGPEEDGARNGVKARGDVGTANQSEGENGDGINDEGKNGANDGVGLQSKDGAESEHRSDQDERKRDGERKSNIQKSIGFHISDDLKRKIEEQMKNVEHYRDDTMDTIRFMLGDVAGQFVYYDVHSIMLRLRTLFILVVDLSKSLGDMAQPTFVDKETKNEKDLGNPLKETNLDYVTRWMAALRNLNPCNNEVGKSSALSINVPKTILVFTKPDKWSSQQEVEKKMKEATDVLEKTLKRIGCESLIVAKYVIKNTVPRNADEASELETLRTKLFKTAQDILKAQEPTPVSWLMLERALDTVRRSEDVKDHPYITLDEARELDEKESRVIETFSEAMKFLHNENIVVHFHDDPALRDLVVLDAAWLVKLFTEVLTVSPDRRGPPTHSLAWKDLTEKGALSFENLPNPLVKQSQKKALKNMMVRAGLISHWRKDVYLVPSMVTKRREESDIHKMLSSCLQPSLYINFCGDSIPLGVFTRFLVKLFKWARGEFEDDDDDSKMPEFLCNYCRIFKSEGSIEYSVVLVKHISRVQVAISVNDVEENACTDIARIVLSTLQDVMKKIQSDNPSFKGIRYDFGFKCDLCGEEKMPCLRHKKEGCADDDCVCILSLECLKKKPTICQRNLGGTRISSRLHETFWLKQRKKQPSKAVTHGVNESSTSGRSVQELERKQTPPDRLQMAEIAEIAEKISNRWVKLAYLTNKFESHEIDNIKFSRCGEDESSKALDMLTKYSEREGTRQKLANKLKKLGMTSLSQDVINGCFIDDDDDD